jgi:hypothetical protein
MKKNIVLMIILAYISSCSERQSFSADMFETVFESIKPLEQLTNQFEIANSSNKVEPQTESFTPVAVPFGQYAESFDNADGVFICNSRACDSPVLQLLLLRQRMKFFRLVIFDIIVFHITNVLRLL